MCIRKGDIVAENVTTKVNIDITDLKKNITEANRKIKLINAQFKESTAGMEKWSKNANGLSAKIKQQKDLIEQEKIKLKSLEEQHKRVADAEGENSKGAEDLSLKIMNQKAKIAQAEAAVVRYSDNLGKLKEEQKKSATEAEIQNSKFGKLRQQITDQEDQLKTLKERYQSAILEFGKSSKEAKTLAKEIGNLSGDLKKNQSIMEKTEEKADNLDRSLEDNEKDTKKVAEGFTTLKGTLSNLVAIGIAQAVQGLKDLASAAKEAYQDYDEGADNVVTATGATGEAADKLRSNYSNVAKSVIGDLSSMGGTLGEVNTRFEFTGKKLEDTTERFIKFGKITNTDATEAVRLVSRAMGDANIKSSKYADLLDQLAVASQASGISVSTLTENLTKYGAPMRELGFSTKESIALFAQWEKAGVNTEIAFSGMKKAISNWSKSGKDAKKEFKKTMDEIAKCPNKTKAAKKAIEAFGAKAGPDMADAIKGGRFEYNKFVKLLEKSEGSVENTYNETEDGFDKVKLAIQKGKVEMGEFMAELLTKYEPQITEFAGKAIEKLKEGATWIAENTDEVKTIGTVLASVFAVSKIAKLASGVKNIVTTFISLKKVIMEATVVQQGLNAAQAASPTGLVIAGATGLVGILGTLAVKSAVATDETENLTEAQQKEKEEIDELIKKHKKTRDSVKEMKDEYEDLRKTREKTVSEATSEFSYYQDLKKELDDIVGKNGEVKKGQEDRAKFIVSTFKEKLGIEIKMHGKIIKKYKEQRKEIDKLIAKKREETIASAYNEEYTEALKKKQSSYTNKKQAEEDLEETNKKLKDAEKKLRDIEEEREKETSKIWARTEGHGREYSDAVKKYEKKVKEAKDEVKRLTGEQEKNKKTLKDADDTMEKYNVTIANYANYQSAALSGNAKKSMIALEKLTIGFKNAETSSEKSLKAQEKNVKKTYDRMQKDFKEGKNGVTKENVELYKTLWEDSKKELDKLAPKAKEAAKKTGKEAKKGLEETDVKSSGEKKSKEYAHGLELGKNKAGKSAKKIGKEIKKEFKKIKTVKDGENFVQGLIDGMESNKKNASLVKAVTAVANTALDGLKKRLDEHSPSRKTRQMGVFFTKGFSKGIEDAYKDVEKAVATLAKRSMKKLRQANKNGSYEEAGEKVSELFEKGIEKQEKRAEKAVKALVNRAVKTAKKGTKSDKLKKGFSDLGEKMISSFDTAFSKAAEKATERVKSKIESLTAAAQEKYDAIKDLQDDLEKRLSDGDIYHEDDAGNVVLTDFKSETAKIIQFGKNMESLKGKLSSELMAEIAELDTEAGLKLTNKLLSLNSADLAAYNKAYTEKLNASKNVANKFYSEQIKKIKDEYSVKLKKVMNGLEDQLDKIGENAMKGFIKGFTSKNKDLSKAVKKLKESLLKDIKRELDIHSPSGVMEKEAGVFIVPGIANGVLKKLPMLKKTMARVSEQITNPMKNAMANANLDIASRGQRLSDQMRQGDTIKNINFYQTNNSPKALSRWEIWRQSKNILGGIQNV